MLVSFLLVVIFMIAYQIPISWNILWFFPILLTVVVFTFGVSSIIMHFGVFAEDLVNLVNIAMRLIFYLTGVFYDLNTRIKNETIRVLLLDFNPMANFIFNLRNVLIYKTSPVGLWTLAWFIVGVLLSIYGIRTIYKYENTYVKVMK